MADGTSTADAALEASSAVEPPPQVVAPLVPTQRAPRGGSLRIAMIGQRGVPATYGGVERHVEELGSRLAARGHRVTVFCRSSYGEEHPATYRGMRLVHLDAPEAKHFEAISHSARSTWSVVRGRYDVVHYHALGPGLLAPLPRLLSRAAVVQTVHGLDNERPKWGRAAQQVLGMAHWMSGHVPDATIVVSEALAGHYRERFHRDAHHIPNGVVAPAAPATRLISERYGLASGSYLLFVGRLVPDKAPDLLLRAFRRLPGDQRLVIAGGSSFTDDYVADLERLAAADPRVVMVGYAYGDLLRELYANAAAFVLPSVLEGMPLTLLEAASYGLPVVVSDIPPHVEVVRRSGPGRRVFAAGDEDDLVAALAAALRDPILERAGATHLRADVLGRYDWDAVTDRTEDLYRQLAREKATP